MGSSVINVTQLLGLLLYNYIGYAATSIVNALFHY
jgi:hypothetical protein